MLDAVVAVLVSRGRVLSLVTSGTPLRLKRRDLKEHVLRRARELAESGRFEGWQGIEFELRFFEGFSKARVWLIGSIRRELDDLCRHARIRSASATTKSPEYCRKEGRVVGATYRSCEMRVRVSAPR
jgi:hypothetical protein